MRKKQSKKRDLIPDPKFNDQLVTRFVKIGRASCRERVCIYV